MAAAVSYRMVQLLREKVKKNNFYLLTKLYSFVLMQFIPSSGANLLAFGATFHNVINI